jgi:hypothetical protein
MNQKRMKIVLVIIGILLAIDILLAFLCLINLALFI